MVKASTGGRLRLEVAGRDLKDLDWFSKSDPICVLEKKIDSIWKKVSQTERIDNDLNPDFQTPLEFEYDSHS